MKIFKYTLEWEETQTINIPPGFVPLALQPQGAAPTLWAKVDPDAPTKAHTVRIFGTGSELPGNEGVYLGTIQAGAFVFHFFCEEDL